MNPAPYVNDLAADVRHSIRPRGPFAGEVRIRQSEKDRVDKSLAALSELVALVGTLTQERDELRRLCSGYASDVDAYDNELYKAGWSDPAWTEAALKPPTARPEAAETVLADMRRALEPFIRAFDKAVRDHQAKWHYPRDGVTFYATHGMVDEARRALAAAAPAPEGGE